MRRLIGLVIVMLATVWSAADLCAQSNEDAAAVPSPLKKPVIGRYVTNYQGEDVIWIELAEIICTPELKFKNKKEEEFYWKTVRDVRKALPYAKLISQTLVETYEYIETLPEKERKDHIKRMESEVFDQYKPQLKKFTKSQAVMLCKLIKRETDQSGYKILQAFLGSFRATFWQAFGRLFGVNLKTDYKPRTDRNDGIIERVASQIEVGLL